MKGRKAPVNGAPSYPQGCTPGIGPKNKTSPLRLKQCLSEQSGVFLFSPWSDSIFRPPGTNRDAPAALVQFGLERSAIARPIGGGTAFCRAIYRVTTSRAEFGPANLASAGWVNWMPARTAALFPGVRHDATVGAESFIPRRRLKWLAACSACL